MPVLARFFEDEGFNTVLVTMMPFWSERHGGPRTLGVEFPFGHPFGIPHRGEMQRTVLREALGVLEVDRPGEIRELDMMWPQPFEEAYKAWQPAEPSPIIRQLRQTARQQAKERVKERRG